MNNGRSISTPTNSMMVICKILIALAKLHFAVGLDSDGSCAMYDILSFKQRSILVRAPEKSISSPSQIVRMLEETEEWGEEWANALFLLISEYDKELSAQKKSQKVPPSKKKKTSS